MTPPKRPTPVPFRRAQSQTERDIEGLQAKHERDAVPVAFEADPITGVLEGPELAAAREEREPIERIRHLETRLDVSLATFTGELEGVKGAVRGVEGELRGVTLALDTLNQTMRDAQEHRLLHVKKQTAIETTEAVEEIKVDSAKQIEAAKVTTSKSERTNRLLAILGTLGTIIATIVAAGRC